MPAKSIECKVVKVLHEQQGGLGTNQLRVVRWIVDGKDTGALLEKRNFFNTKEGDQKMGKAKGLNREDIELVIQQWNEIKKMME